MTRRRFISKGNITIIDGVGKTAVQRRITKLDVKLSQQMGKWLLTKRSRNKRNEKKQKSTQISDENENDPEMERWRNIVTLAEAEEFELIIENDDDDYVFKDSSAKTDRVLAEVDNLNTNNTEKRIAFANEMNSGISAKKNENEMSAASTNKSPLLFVVHRTEPTTSTPLRAIQSARSSHCRPELIFAGHAGLSPIVADSEIVTPNTTKKTAISSRSGSEISGAPMVIEDEQEKLTSAGQPIPLVTEKSVQNKDEIVCSEHEAMNSTTYEGPVSQLTILNSPGHWGFGEEEYACEDVASSLSLQYNRSLSLCDGGGDNRPFYLDGFPWTARYARQRDYKEELFHLCRQKGIQTWRVGRSVLDLSNPLKLGEGTFGEVFRVRYKGGIVALKVIPIGGTKLINGDKQKSFRDIAAELIVSKELSDLSELEDGYSTMGFVRLMGAMVVKGSYPKSLVTAWEQYDERIKSENDHPRIFDSSQHFLLLAFEDGGTDLEKYKISNVLQAYSIVYQVLMALSVGEYRLLFEHRDLHCGNILIGIVEPDAYVRENLNGVEVNIRTYGVEVKIIDFTLSRMSKGTSTIFYDLAKDDGLFAGEGLLQYDIYRIMRKATRNNWFPFCSTTNVIWLIYLVRYIYDNMDENEIGSLEEREEFICHFRNLRRYGSLYEWLVENGGKRNDIIRINENIR